MDGIFPDKQKQYKYSSEIPPLEIPPDLTSSTIDGVSRRGVSSGDAPIDASNTQNSSDMAVNASPQTPNSSNAGESSATDGKSSGHAALAQNTQDVPLIEIGAPFDVAWVEVSKALGRMELEISDQNRAEGVFYVYYGSDSKPQESKGFFGDVANMFSGSGGQSKEFRVKLEGHTKLTMVYVLDSENKAQTDGAGLELLKKLNQTLDSLTDSDTNSSK
jgi:uncharacterized lipoprotein